MTTLELVRWVAWAKQKGGEDWFRARGLSFEQGFVLRYLQQQPGVMQRDIAHKTRRTAASVSSLLQGLQRRGLIERRMEDGDERSKRVHATAAGLDLIEGIDSAMAGVDESILAPLTRDEQAVLHTLLEKITAALPNPTRP